MKESYFVFREPELFDELKSLLLLRFSVYMGSRLNQFATPYRSAGIELDCYDLRSRHFGLFKHDGGVSRPVGYLRVVTEEKSRWENELRAIAAPIPELARAVGLKPTVPLPLMTYYADADIVRRHYEVAKANNHRPAEAGRLSLQNDIRSIAIARHMISSTLASGIVNGHNAAFITVVPSHVAFYGAYGFRICIGSRQRFCPKAQTEFSCLQWTFEQMDGAMQEVVLSMAEAYSHTGRICCYPSMPGQYYAPTRSHVPSKPRLTAAA